MLVWLSVGNLASALAPGYVSLNVLRLAAGQPNGTYFGVVALWTATFVAPHRRACAIGHVMVGLTSATLVGVSIAAWLGQRLG